MCIYTIYVYMIEQLNDVVAFSTRRWPKWTRTTDQNSPGGSVRSGPCTSLLGASKGDAHSYFLDFPKLFYKIVYGIVQIE